MTGNVCPGCQYDAGSSGCCPNCGTVFSRDGCVVPTEPLSSALSVFVKTWNRTRPAGSPAARAEVARTGLSLVSAVDWLEQETGVPAATIHKVVAVKHRHTELRIADALVAAIQRTDLFYDGKPPTLEILPNPNAPKPARACCRRDYS